MTGYAGFAAPLQANTPLGDPWLDGRPRLCSEPLCVPRTRAAELAAAAAGIAAVHDELAQLATAEPELLDSFFGLTPWQRAMWQCSAPDWHGIARADVFCTAAGAQVCELNSDTPSGAAEAVLLSAAAAAANPGHHDPNAGLPRRFCRLVADAAARCGHHGALTVGIVYPTELTEDLSMVAVYRDWLVAAGHRVVLGSPFNLGRCHDGRATVLDTPCEVIVRHYKTDWFGERLPVADDDPPCEDQEPLAGPLLALLQAAVLRRTAVINPFGAVLTQNKRAMAFCWEAIDRFSPPAQAAIRRWLPYTTRLELVRDELWQQRSLWVLKSDYGCEGDEVILGPKVDQATWEAALSRLIVRRWVAQRWFEALPEADGDLVNHGVYLVAGAPAGMLLRRHGPGATDVHARIAPALVTTEDLP
jgi:glutathionylspermidine synthase